MQVGEAHALPGLPVLPLASSGTWAFFREELEGEREEDGADLESHLRCAPHEHLRTLWAHIY